MEIKGEKLNDKLVLEIGKFSILKTVGTIHRLC